MAVQCACPEKAGGTDDAPEDGAVEVDAGDGTGEAGGGVGRADAGNGSQRPVEDEDLSQRGDGGGGELEGEEEAGRDVHVVAEFEVGGEFEGLGGGYLGW